jgi:hypothetical protein
MVLLSCVGLLIVGTMSYAGDQSSGPLVGVVLDGAPLPELLTKHLGLEPGQGLRIANVNVGGPADKAGLERDDIIVGFQGEKVMNAEQFIAAVHRAGAGAEVSLEVIHLGQRKTVQLKLEPMGKVDLKYPSEPEATESWRPGKIFRIGPNGREWMEMPFDKLRDFNLDVNKFFKEVYRYNYKTDGEEYTVTIEGDPADEGTSVTVQAGDAKYSTTVGKIDALPEKYRQSAREAIDNARESSKDVHLREAVRLPEPPWPGLNRRFFDTLPRPDFERWSEEKDRMLERLQQEMDQLRQRIKQLEERLPQEMRNVLPGKKGEASPESKPAEKPAPPQGEDKSAV